MLLPYLHSDELLKRAEFYAHFERGLAARGFPVVNLQPVYASHGTGPLIVHRFDPHTNAFANQLAADAVTAYLGAHPELLGGAAR